MKECIAFITNMRKWMVGKGKKSTSMPKTALCIVYSWTGKKTVQQEGVRKKE